MFERQILTGLAMEWGIAEAYLPLTYRGRMMRPGFELRDLETNWGMWEGGKKNIVLSRRLIGEYSWKSVREVLLHEMAHQLADEVLGGNESPHGLKFREACRLLGADPSASGPLPSIYERLEEDEIEDKDRIIVRVHKLLAMARSSNRHEAEVAMAKAHDFIMRYNIDLLSADRAKAYCSICIGEPAGRQSADKYAMAALLRAHYFVETVWIQMFVLAKGRQGRILEISGSHENVKMAEYVHGFLNRAIDEQWELYRAGRWAGRMERTDFAIGLIEGFREKLESGKKALESTDSRSSALIRTEDRHLKAYLRERYSNLRKTGSRGRFMDEEAHSAGKEAGRTTILHRPVESGPGGKIRMLGEG